MASSAVTADFRSAQADLVTLTVADLEAFWRTLDTSDPSATQNALLSFLPDLVQTYGEIGAADAADFYEELRDSSPDVRRPYSAVLPDELVPVEQVEAATRWALGPLWTAEDDLALAVETALTNLSGVTNRLTLIPARDTVRANAASDPESVGWRRVGNGDSCAFCRMLIGRGNVYSADTARFASHDHCDCIAEPSWGGGEPASVIQYMASKRNPTKADRARVREFLRGLD
ncbi:hypothetical protein [Promicromonospora kroppenstedtii]|uniref:VG15 protein n=1 Tax=Promicromonospora kroppenstedtii TaxID=440482 RepID=UPI0004BBB81C|nr:hypothetical protein [Promicromonospora kroppenstedtii]